ncbi:hypothetical protein D3C73_788300 [compost metagenome]
MHGMIFGKFNLHIRINCLNAYVEVLNAIPVIDGHYRIYGIFSCIVNLFLIAKCRLYYTIFGCVMPWCHKFLRLNVLSIGNIGH